MAGIRTRRLVGLVAVAALMAGCAEGAGPFASRAADTGTEAAPAALGSTRIVERDTEAPEIFQTTKEGLWDGRPSLGGVWVAYEGVKDPERVIIRNEATGKFVIGALFRRERDNPGPPLQVSSDAAQALGMLAGAPAALNVTALKREEVPMTAAAETGDAAGETPDDADIAGAAPPAAAPAAGAGSIETASLDAVAGAAIARAEPAAAPAPQVASAPPAISPAPPVEDAAPGRKASPLSKGFVQIGIFSVEDNARNTVTAMKQAGLPAETKRSQAAGKDYWRVVVGPATSESDRAAILKKVKGLGFSDAYAVSG